MKDGNIVIYYGEGRGKTTAAIGQGIKAVGEGLSVILIQFLDYNNTKENVVLKKLEPDFKVIRFEKVRENVNSLNETELKEIKSELVNAFNFSRKVFETGECDVIILDGIFSAIEYGFITEDQLCELLEKRQSNMDVLLTGSKIYDKIKEKADYIYRFSVEKKK